MTKSEIRDIVITGSYLIGDGMKEPAHGWKDYANKLEDILVKNNGVLRIVSNSLPTIECERCNKLATHKANLLEENHKLRQRLIDAGLEQPAIRNDIRG